VIVLVNDHVLPLDDVSFFLNIEKDLEVVNE